MNTSLSSLTIGRVFWLFGMSGAGKTTLAKRLGSYLRTTGRSVLMLDGDQLRAGVCRDLDFSDGARRENIRRAAEIALLGSSQGYVVIAAFITPFESFRDRVREIIGDRHVDLIWVDTPLEVCQQRDPKRLYAGHRDGKVRQMTGLDSKFEAPLQQDLRLRTANQTIEQSFHNLLTFCENRFSHSIPATSCAEVMDHASESEASRRR